MTKIGSISVDIEKGSRQYSVKYTLSTAKGVASLLRDHHRLASRRYHAGDYDACVILADLETAIERANLTSRQRSVIALIYGEDLRQVDAAERLGVGQDAVSHCLKGAIKRITRVYRGWEYGDISVQYEKEDNLYIGEEIDEEMEIEEMHVREEMVKSGIPIQREDIYDGDA